ncbi:dUTP diphosphatase [Mesobacillus thioparans]
MKPQLTIMFEHQKALDDRIIKKHQLEGRDLIENKLVALLVEIGELANTTRCFKHWSLKPAAPKEEILEEFVDGIHFFISLAIDFGITPGHFVVQEEYIESDLTASFYKLYEYITNIGLIDLESELIAAFSLFIGIGEKHLGFTWEEIVKAYFEKNEVNHHRQDNGY